MFNQNIDSQIIDHEKKTVELGIQNDSLDLEISDLLSSFKVTEKQLTSYLTTQNNFTQSQWETIKKEQERLNEALEAKLALIPDLQKKRKKQDERFISPHWLFVR